VLIVNLVLQVIDQLVQTQLRVKLHCCQARLHHATAVSGRRHKTSRRLEPPDGTLDGLLQAVGVVWVAHDVLDDVVDVGLQIGDLEVVAFQSADDIIKTFFFVTDALTVL